MEKPSQRGLAYLLLSLPLIVGLLFPTVSLDTTIVEAKGFNFPVSKESVGDPDMQTQYLKPDTSMYFNKTDYDKQMAKAMKQYDGQSVISITDENYLEIMELIYNYPSQFAGKGFLIKALSIIQKEKKVLTSLSSVLGLFIVSLILAFLACWFIFLNILNFKTMIG